MTLPVSMTLPVWPSVRLSMLLGHSMSEKPCWMKTSWPIKQMLTAKPNSYTNSSTVRQNIMQVLVLYPTALS